VHAIDKMDAGVGQPLALLGDVEVSAYIAFSTG